MKVIEKYLYTRNGHLYYRSIIPRPLQALLKFKEVAFALSSRDIEECRVIAAQIHLQKCLILKEFQSALKCRSKSPEEALSIPKERICKLSAISNKLSSFEASLSPLHRKNLRLFSDIAKQYMADHAHNATRTKALKKRTYEIFIELMGDLNFGEITIKEAREFKSKLQLIPIHANIQ